MRSAWRQCGRKVFYRYVAGIEPVKTGKALVIGSAFHRGLEAIRTDDTEHLENFVGAELERIEDRDDRAVALAQVLAYLTGYQGAFRDEGESWVEVNPFSEYDQAEVGFVDKVARFPDGSLWIIEDKTTARFEDRELVAMALRMNDQIGTYTLAFRDRGIEVSGVKYRQVLKTQTRVKKTETVRDYGLRLIDSYLSEPTTFYREISVSFSNEELDKWAVQKERENLDAIQYLDQYDIDRWPFNGSSCIGPYGACEYLKLCSRRCDGSQREFQPNGKAPLDGGKFQTKIWSTPSPEARASEAARSADFNGFMDSKKEGEASYPPF